MFKGKVLNKSLNLLGEVPGHGKAINAIKCNDSCIFTASRL